MEEKSLYCTDREGGGEFPDKGGKCSPPGNGVSQRDVFSQKKKSCSAQQLEGGIKEDRLFVQKKGECKGTLLARERSEETV